jgi:hypothetical protein
MEPVEVVQAGIEEAPLKIEVMDLRVLFFYIGNKNFLT